MADNVSIANAANVPFNAATDELSDGSHAPKVQLLDGTTGTVPISPATSGRQDTGNASLSSIQTNVALTPTNIGATNEAAAASDTATSGLNGLIKRYLQRFTTFLALLPASLGQKTKAGSFAVTLASDDDSHGIQKRARAFARSQVTVARPADTTTYAAGDAWGTGASAVWTFPNAAASAAGAGAVKSATIVKNGNTTANASFKLHLYQLTPLSAPAGDNLAIAFSHHSDRARYVGAITFGAAVAGTAGTLQESNGTSRGSELFFQLVSGTDLFGLVEVLAAYAPTSAENMTITLDIEQGK